MNREKQVRRVLDVFSSEGRVFASLSSSCNTQGKYILSSSTTIKHTAASTTFIRD
jgi:hypothetical protein